MAMWGTNMSARAFTRMREFFGTRWGQRSEHVMDDRFTLSVHFAYDEEADVWYVAKSDIPGLSLEAGSPIELLDRVIKAAPELIELNSGVLAEVVGVRSTEEGAARRAPARRTSKRQPWSVRPVFDAPMDLACA